jgi:hypothetical protein
MKRDTFSRLSCPVVDDVTTYHSIFLQKEGSQCFMEYLELPFWYYCCIIDHIFLG